MALLTTVQVCRKLGIPRSTLYYMLRSGVLEAPEKSANRCRWSEDEVANLKKLLRQKALKKAEKIKKAGQKREKAPYKTVSINNRRFLGSKYKLTPFIRKIVQEHCRGIRTVADIFAGTGAVAAAFMDKDLIVNDNLYSNYVCHLAWFGTQRVSRRKIIEQVQAYNRLEATEENYMSQNFGGAYFSRAVCRKIGFIRENIEQSYAQGLFNERERAVLLTSLLYAMDKIANTCGHYDAYRKNGDLTAELELAVPDVSNGNHPANRCCHRDANELVREIQADLVYIDPPYNSRQYCDSYHLLENVARWEQPEVSGVARKMPRGELKSAYCTQKAAQAFEDLVQHIDAKYILLSYNNMAEKGDGRSNAKISDEDIYRILSQKGRVSVYSMDYKAFSAGKSNITGNEERLFLCSCRKKKSVKKEKYLQSPLNYMGGKYQLLPQLLPYFPKNVHTLVDLFCGGGNVGVNFPAEKVVLNDSSKPLLELLELFCSTGVEELLHRIDAVIGRYGLSKSAEQGYAYYGCSGSSGLAGYNREPYLKLRGDFNALPPRHADYALLLYVLVVYSFNNQIRFNREGAFNLPVGKRDFNPRMRAKLEAFVKRLQSGRFELSCKDFRQVDLSALGRDSLVYCDPPYLITCATYNEQGGWNEDCERDLLAFLDGLHRRGIRFALSNVLRSKGRENRILMGWLAAHAEEYRAIRLNYHYANCNYHTKDRSEKTEEVLIVNYSEDGT